jgi:hypothetical protein
VFLITKDVLGSVPLMKKPLAFSVTVLFSGSETLLKNKLAPVVPAAEASFFWSGVFSGESAFCLKKVGSVWVRKLTPP